MTDADIERVAERYAAMLLRAAFCQTQNMADAEDVVQETYLRYMNKAPAFSGDEHEKAWLLRVAINLGRSRASSAWRQKIAPLSEEIPSLDENESAVLEAVAALPPKYRAVVHLHYYEGYSIAETAKLLSLGVSAVTSQLSRARQKLSVLLKEDCAP